MKKWIFIVGMVLALVAPVGAVDLVSVFGNGLNTCTFVAGKTSLVANNTDSTTLTLTVNGTAYAGAVTVLESNTNISVANVHFPQTVTASAPGTWNLSITAPPMLAGRCPGLVLMAN